MRKQEDLNKLLKLICECYQEYVNVGYSKNEAVRKTVSNYSDMAEWLYSPQQIQKNLKQNSKNSDCCDTAVNTSADSSSRKQRRINNLRKRLGECMSGLSKRKKQQAKDHLFKTTLKKFDDVLYWQVVDRIEKESISKK